MHSLILLALTLPAARHIQDGSLLVLENSNKPVAQVTGASITHVALIFHRNDVPWVYEATPARVRCVTLTKYRRELGELNRDRSRPIRVTVMQPKYPYSEAQIERMRSRADSQLGRRYSIKGYVRGQESDGIHCAHLAATTLAASGRFQFDQAYAISPDKLVAHVSPLYKSRVPMVVQPVATSSDSWCQRSWTTWFNYGAWCRWACYEAWTFCW